MKKENRNNKGFSLVELIVVIAIMAVLVGVLAPQFLKYVEKSRESTDITTLDNIATALKTYYTDHEVAGGGDTVTVTFTGGKISGTVDKGVADAGLKDASLKGRKWTTQPSIKLTISTGKIEYTGAAEYYILNANKDGFVAE